MLKFGNDNIGKAYFGNNAIGKMYLGNNLVYQRGIAPVEPYTRVEYIQTDGVAYINTGILGNHPKGAMLKSLISEGGAYFNVLGTGVAGEPSTSIFAPLHIASSGNAGFAYNYYYTDGPSLSDSITNGTPFISITNLPQRGGDGGESNQYLEIRQAGEGRYTGLTKTSTANVVSDKQMYLFCRNTNNSPTNNMPSGSRIYYCRIYSDPSLKTLVFDGIPALYRGEYGLWDNVTHSFYGNAASSGAFSGPSTAYGQYIPIDYIEGDGVAYINTGVYGNDDTSAEIKFTPVAAGGTILGTGTGNEDANGYCPFLIGSASVLGFQHYYNYTSGAPSIADSITNGTPFEAKVDMRPGTHNIYVKQAGESEYTSLSKTQNTTITTNKPMYLFARCGNSTLAPANYVASGSRLHYCKIYQDNSYRYLAFDGVPCIYNGEYGLWDRVTETFFGNANSTGAFSGPVV